MSLLDQILQSTRQRVGKTRASANLHELEHAASQHSPRGFRRNLAEKAVSGVAVIAELKKASPSKGLIRANFDPASLAGELAGAGAAALSVLTDEQYFQGSLENLRAASRACQIPCLRKDFIVDDFQILEARAYGADAILLIVAGLTDPELKALSAAARQIGIDVLCEVHDEEELERALNLGFETIGVNNRNLKTFVVDLETSLRLRAQMPTEVFCVAESGIESGADIARLSQAGFGAFLIGESLMRAERPGSVLKELLEAGAPSLSRSVRQGGDFDRSRRQ